MDSSNFHLYITVVNKPLMTSWKSVSVYGSIGGRNDYESSITRNNISHANADHKKNLIRPTPLSMTSQWSAEIFILLFFVVVEQCFSHRDYLVKNRRKTHSITGSVSGQSTRSRYFRAAAVVATSQQQQFQMIAILVMYYLAFIWF